MIKRAQNKVLIVMLMLVTFIGQAMASTTMSYATASCTHESMNADMANMVMNHDDMMSAIHDETNDQKKSQQKGQEKNQGTMMDCCQEQCQCPMNGCVSLSLLVDTRFNYLAITEQRISQLSSLHRSQINSSLYRPPIS